MCPNAANCIERVRPVPFVIKEAIEEELNNLEKSGVIEKVSNSRWAAPIVRCSPEEEREISHLWGLQSHR